MGIELEAKDLEIVDGTEKLPVFHDESADIDELTFVQLTKSSSLLEEKDAEARMLISTGVTQKIVGKLTGSSTAASQGRSCF